MLELRQRRSGTTLSSHCRVYGLRRLRVSMKSGLTTFQSRLISGSQAMAGKL